jgi:phage tail protein X
LLLVNFCGDADAVTAVYYGMLEKIQHAICHSSHGLLQQGMITATPGPMLPAGLGIDYVVTA